MWDNTNMLTLSYSVAILLYLFIISDAIQPLEFTTTQHVVGFYPKLYFSPALHSNF